MTIRSDFVDALKPALPSGWRFIPYQRDIDMPSAVTVMFKLSKLTPHPSVNRTFAFVADCTVTVIAPQQNPEKAEDELDDAVPELMKILSGLRVAQNGKQLPLCTVTNATKAQFGSDASALTCFDISITTAASEE